MRENPRSKHVDLAAVGLALFLLGLACAVGCHGILAAKSWVHELDNKPAVRP